MRASLSSTKYLTPLLPKSTRASCRVSDSESTYASISSSCFATFHIIKWIVLYSSVGKSDSYADMLRLPAKSLIIFDDLMVYLMSQFLIKCNERRSECLANGNQSTKAEEGVIEIQ